MVVAAAAAGVGAARWRRSRCLLQEQRGIVCASHDTALMHLPTHARTHARTHTGSGALRDALRQWHPSEQPAVTPGRRKARCVCSCVYRGLCVWWWRGGIGDRLVCVFQCMSVREVSPMVTSPHSQTVISAHTLFLSVFPPLSLSLSLSYSLALSITLAHSFSLAPTHALTITAVSAM